MFKKWMMTTWMIVVLAACSWALLPPQFFRAHDYVHAARIAELTRAVSDGHVPPIWAKDFGWGYGMPLFEFYAPLPYYFGAFWYWLGVPVVLTVKLLFITSGIGVLLGGYFLGKELFGRWGGLVAGAAMCLAPYRAVNLFVRGAVSEAWGMMWMPWVLYGVVRVVAGKKRGWQWLALSSAALVLSHNIMAMLFLPLAGLFALAWWGYRRWLKPDQVGFRQLFQLGGAFALAAGMSVYYMVPALVEYPLTKINSIFSGYFHYSQHFLYLRQFAQVHWGFTGSVWGPNDGISFFLGWGQWLGMAVAGALLGFAVWLTALKKSWKKLFSRPVVGTLLMSGALLVISLFMSLAKSAFIWDAIPPLAKAQFPWRFLGPAVVFIGLVVGAGVAMIPTKVMRTAGAVVIMIALLVNGWFFRPEKYLDNAHSLYYDDPERIASQMSGVLPDYIPVQMVDDPTPPQQLVSCVADFQLENSGCDGEVKILADKTHQKLVSLKLKTDTRVAFAVSDFPGWRVELDGQPAEKLVDDFGTIAVQVPAGEHQVGLIFGSSPVRAWSNAASVVSWLAFVVLASMVKDGDD